MDFEDRINDIKVSIWVYSFFIFDSKIRIVKFFKRLILIISSTYNNSYFLFLVCFCWRVFILWGYNREDILGEFI